MQDPRADAIRTRAYEIWKAEGRPEGRDEAHWLQAKRELDQSAKTPGGDQLPDPDLPGSPGTASNGFEAGPVGPDAGTSERTRRPRRFGQ